MKKSARKTPTAADHVIKLNPVVYRLNTPKLEAYGDTRHRLWSIRKIPRNDLEKRRSEAERLKGVVPDRTRKAWEQRERECVLTGLHGGSLENFHRWLFLYGPRGLWLAFSDPEILKLVEGWWIDGALLGDGAAQESIEKTLSAAITQRLGNDTKFSNEEQRRKKTGNDLQIRTDKRAVAYCDRAWRRYVTDSAGITDPGRLRKIALNIAREEFSRDTQAMKEGKRLFLQQVTSGQERGTVEKIPS